MSSNINDTFHGYIIANNIEKVNFLLEIKDQINLDINYKNHNGSTALSIALSNGYTEIVKLLLEKGVNTNIKDKRGYTPLLLASNYGFTEIVKLLLEKGDDVNIRDEEGNTALSFALKNGYTEIAELLKSKNGENDENDENDNDNKIMMKMLRKYKVKHGVDKLFVLCYKNKKMYSCKKI